MLRVLGDAGALLLAAIDIELEEPLAAAKVEPPPARDTLFDDVYARRPWHLFEQARELERG